MGLGNVTVTAVSSSDSCISQSFVQVIWDLGVKVWGGSKS